jgi:hypothetical protein
LDVAVLNVSDNETKVLGYCCREMHAIFWLENLKERDNSEDLGVDGKIILECILGKYGGNVWTGIIWFRIGTNGWLL